MANGVEVEILHLCEGAGERVLKRILIGEEYPLPYLPDFHPDVVLDVGAHVGAASVFFATAFPRARVEAFEPSSRAFGLLVQNTAGFPSIRARRFGLLDETGERDLFLSSRAGLGDSISAPRRASRGVRIERVAMKAAGEILPPLISSGSTVLKVDTEGCEVPILRGMGESLGHCMAVYVEYHSRGDRREILSLMEEAFDAVAENGEREGRGTLTFLSRRVEQV